jgi:hypothetical protein
MIDLFERFINKQLVRSFTFAITSRNCRHVSNKACVLSAGYKELKQLPDGAKLIL